MSKEVKGYVYAYDPIIKRRVVHVLIDGWAISLVTGHKRKVPKGLELEEMASKGSSHAKILAPTRGKRE